MPTRAIAIVDQRVAQQAVLLERIARSVPGIWYIYDPMGPTPVFSTRCLAEMLGYDQDRISQIGHELIDLLTMPEDAATLEENRRAVMESADGEETEFDVRLLSGRCEYVWIRCRERVFERDATGRPTLVIGVAHDATRQKEAQQMCLRQIVQLQRAQEKLQNQRIALAKANAELARLNRELETLSLTDSLTGAHNRRALTAYLEPTLLVDNRSGAPLSILMIDVDHFKLFNDRYGHQAGDDALKTVYRTLRRTIRSSDFSSRYGGEEFLVVLPDTDVAGAQEVAERIRLAVARQRRRGRSLTVSIGVATYRPGEDTMQTLVGRADSRLYSAKHAGRNMVHA